MAPQTLDRWEAEGKFPQRIPLPDVDEAFWLEREIDAWTGDVKSRDPEKETG